MHVNSTEIQNNFGKYLMLAAREDIIITKNGREVAKLSAAGSLYADGSATAGLVNEEAPEYYSSYGNYGGRKATYQEFLELTANSDERYEYIDGEIYYLESPKEAHQAALTELVGSFYNWFKGKKCTPRVAPYDITLRRTLKDINVVQPDMVVICDLEENLNDRDYYMGTPALAVEIISKSTRSKDFVKKLDLYIWCGVKEYWIVNPLKKEISIYLLDYGNKDIIEYNTYRVTDMAESFIFKGLSIRLDSIFK